MNPLVSVICLCYNHERFVAEAIQSVFDQTYKNVQVIIVDDASADGSVAVIDRFLKLAGRPDVAFIRRTENGGNCRSFNDGLVHATGKYVIDFAADDIMMPERLANQVVFFESRQETTGVIFSDATYVSEDKKFLYHHFDDLKRKGLLHDIPKGDVFKEVLTQYFISSPTMMIRKRVLDELGGYDPQLAYEDFDFWVRSTRKHNYEYTLDKSTLVRKSPKSMSTGWYKQGDKQLHSTYLVCRKAQKLVRDRAETHALITRVRYELKQSAFSENFYEATLFFALLKELTSVSVFDQMLLRMAQMKIPLAGIRNLYYKFRFG